MQKSTKRVHTPCVRTHPRVTKKQKKQSRRILPPPPNSADLMAVAIAISNGVIDTDWPYLLAQSTRVIQEYILSFTAEEQENLNRKVSEASFHWDCNSCHEFRYIFRTTQGRHRRGARAQVS